MHMNDATPRSIVHPRRSFIELARHRPFTTDRDIADTDGQASLGLTREQRVRDPIGSDLVIAALQY